MDSQRTYTGKGIGVAVLDTGIYPHVDFDDRICYFQDFINKRIHPYDDNGHGTHVSGIIAGSGKASNGTCIGVAPDASLISLKVLDGMGNGTQEHTMAALQWLLKYHEKYRIRIVNISVGSVQKKMDQYSKLLNLVERVWDEGLIVVAAAGNAGPKTGSITVPGNSRKVITVGSSDMLKQHRQISGQGPTEHCICKPDIVYKGYNILSCLASSDRNGYTRKSGTSMSTPAISGAIALALEKDPLLTNKEIKMMIRGCAKDLGLPHNQQGWGEFDLLRFMDF